MATTRQPVLSDNLLGGLETSLPAHLLQPGQWRTLHNMRHDPGLVQVEKKRVYAMFDTTTVLWIGSIPNPVAQGYGKVLFLTTNGLYTIVGTPLKENLVTDSNYRRWSTFLYNGSLYYINELNPLRRNDGSSDVVLANAPSGRYATIWYDHVVVGFPTYKNSVYPNRAMWSDLYNFGVWEPDAANEADHYDFVEWQNTDFPFCGVTGLGKLGSTLWFYTPTALIPMVYVGKPKVTQVVESNIITGIGNTFPWSLAVMNNVHFFFDGIRKSFFAFDGGAPEPIGEPVRQYMVDNLNLDPGLASRMWASVDYERGEVIWRFVSRDSTGPFDKLVRFSFWYKRWSTGSDENVHAFCGPTFRVKTIGELPGTIGSLTGSIGMLGTDGAVIPRLYGTIGGDGTDIAVVPVLGEGGDAVGEDGSGLGEPP
jgi:hypothetical protein